MVQFNLLMCPASSNGLPDFFAPSSSGNFSQVEGRSRDVPRHSGSTNSRTDFDSTQLRCSPARRHKAGIGGPVAFGTGNTAVGFKDSNC